MSVEWDVWCADCQEEGPSIKRSAGNPATLYDTAEDRTRWLMKHEVHDLRLVSEKINGYPTTVERSGGTSSPPTAGGVAGGPSRGTHR